MSYIYNNIQNEKNIHAEIIKFMFLSHIIQKRVQEELLKEVTKVMSVGNVLNIAQKVEVTHYIQTYTMAKLHKMLKLMMLSIDHTADQVEEVMAEVVVDVAVINHRLKV